MQRNSYSDFHFQKTLLADLIKLRWSKYCKVMLLKEESQTVDSGLFHKIERYWSERCLLSCQRRMAQPDVNGSSGDTGLKVNSWWILLLVRKSSFSFSPPTELDTRHQMLSNGHVRQCPKWVLENNRCNCFVFVMVTDDLSRCAGIFWEKVHIATKKKGIVIWD